MSESQKPRVLVAEDEDTLRTVISEVLEDAGYPVTAVPSAEEALGAFRRESHPIVVTDIVMKKMTGLQLLEEVKTVEPDTVVVVMTSHASLEAATRALRSGAYDFMVKPFEDLDVITATIQRAAEKAELVRSNRLLTEDLKHKAVDLNRANTALIQLADSLKDYANKDGLTGLFNHRLFREALNRELAQAQRSGEPVSVIFMDVDHFKQFNDRNGHLAGDDVLKTLARLMKDQVEKPGLVARYGGEEIVALVPGKTKDETRELAEHIRSIVENHPFPGRERQPLGRVTLSLGVASYPADGADADAMIGHADDALYQAKNAGRNRVCG